MLAAARDDVDLVVAGGYRHASLNRLVAPSVAHDVLDCAESSVLLVPAGNADADDAALSAAARRVRRAWNPTSALR